MNRKSSNISLIDRKILCCLKCSVLSVEVEESRTPTYFHWQILKCRLLMAYMENNFILAAPIPREERNFYVITTIEFYKNNLFKSLLQELRIPVSEPIPITDQIYLSCLKYTIDFHISPEWNRVSSLYLEGVNFWDPKKTHNYAAKWNIQINKKKESLSDEISIEIVGTEVHLLPVRLQDLFIPYSEIVLFMDGRKEIIKMDSYKTSRISVLPSMRKGRVMRILKNIPKNCPFENWNDIRRHWKNTYGYRLPKTDEGIYYYEIYFPMSEWNEKKNLFLYPNICVRLNLDQRPCDEKTSNVTARFINSFTEILPKIGGSILQPLKPESTNAKSDVATMEKEPTKEPELQNQDTNNIIKNTPNIVNNNFRFIKNAENPSASGEKLNQRQFTTPMSPTRSLLGKRGNQETPRKGLKCDDFFKKVKTLHEPTSSTKMQSSSSYNILKKNHQTPSFSVFNNSPKSSPLAPKRLFFDSFPLQSPTTKVLNIFFNPSNPTNNNDDDNSGKLNETNGEKQRKPTIINEEIMVDKVIIKEKKEN